MPKDIRLGVRLEPEDADRFIARCSKIGVPHGTMIRHLILAWMQAGAPTARKEDVDAYRAANEDRAVTQG